MEKINFCNLIIEVTRRCNMQCPHCLRGESENIDIPDEYIEKLLMNVESIGSITFTGGEPTLALDKIKKTRDLLKKYNIPIENFYIVTNGKVVTNDFMLEMMNWTVMVIDGGGDLECCGVALSKDKYHEPIPSANEAKLRALSVFREDKMTDFNKTQLLALGRARNLNVPKRDPWQSDLDVSPGNYVETEITLTADGHLLPQCDYEYSACKTIAIGHVEQMPDFISLVTKAASKTA